MATIKSYTDLSQSRKLVEILPLESADMCWQQIYDENHMMSDYRVGLIPYRLYSGIGIPCWSLAALLNILPEYNLQRTDWGNKTEYKIVVTVNEDNYASKNYDNPLDACYEMVLELHELNLL